MNDEEIMEAISEITSNMTVYNIAVDSDGRVTVNGEEDPTQFYRVTTSDDTGEPAPQEEVTEEVTPSQPLGYRNHRLGYGFNPIPFDNPDMLEIWVDRVTMGTYLMREISDRNSSIRYSADDANYGAWKVVLLGANAGTREEIHELWVTNYWADRFREADRLGRHIAAANITVIQPNSGSYSVDETTTRFSGAIWYEKLQTKEIVLAGVGGIGSYIGFLLGRMKPSRLIIYDDDIVEAVNMSGQLYGLSDIGQHKVDALADMISNYANYNSIVAMSSKFTETSIPSDIMICGFDNMKARILFFNVWVNHVMNKPEEERANCLFIDGRLAAEELQVLAIQGNDDRAMKLYRDNWLFSDFQADETVCSYKQTTFMANMIASIMVNIFVNFVANECNPILPRDVPFYTSYAADTMYFKVEM